MGTGLAGLATAQLAKRQGHAVQVLSKGPSASMVGAGLLHPFGGTRAKLNRFGLEGMKESLQLIPQSAIVQRGIIRLAIDDELKSNFQATGLPWLSAKEVTDRNPGAPSVPAIFIENGYVIDMKAYLEHLSRGLEINTPEKEADITIWAIGAHSDQVKKVKGQTLKIKMKDHGIHETLNSHCYIIPQPEGILVGATFERDAIDWEPNLEQAKQLLFPKLKQMIPQFDESKIESMECAAGVRATTPDHLPFIKQLDSKNWLITGLGSKGLLYHALYAKQLLQRVFSIIK